MQSDQFIKITQGDAKQVSAPLHNMPHRHPAYGPISRRCFLEFAITSTSAHVRNLTFTQVLKFMYFWQLFGYNLNPDAFVSLSAAIKKEIDAISNQSKVADSLVLRKMGVFWNQAPSTKLPGIDSTTETVISKIATASSASKLLAFTAKVSISLYDETS